MLKSIDILIGLTVVMLALSMAVTVITQSITSIVNSRGRHLRRGLTDLLRQLDPALTPALSKVVATRVLTHPLVSGSSTPMAAELESDGWWAWLTARIRALAGGPRLGNVVLREEFTKLLMTFATDNGLVRLDQSARDALRTALANNGVADPDATLRNVRAVALQISAPIPNCRTASARTSPSCRKRAPTTSPRSTAGSTRRWIAPRNASPRRPVRSPLRAR